MLALLISFSCTSPPVADTADTAPLPPPDMGASWSPRVPGPYNQLCENYPSDERVDNNKNNIREERSRREANHVKQTHAQDGVWIRLGSSLG